MTLKIKLRENSGNVKYIEQFYKFGICIGPKFGWENQVYLINMAIWTQEVYYNKIQLKLV